MAAWDLPISHNPLLTRDDLILSLDQMMEPLLCRFVRGNSGLWIGNSAAHYDDSIALMEGLSRLFWGLGPYAAGGSSGGASNADRGSPGAVPSAASKAATKAASGADPGAAAKAVALARGGLLSGTDPRSPYYWGVGGDRDQRFVEMASISLSLLIAPGEFWEPLAETARANLASWLAAINTAELPPTNWEFFRVLVNLALRRLGRPYDPDRLERGLAAVDALYRGDGWYIDETNFDLYNPFGFHFYGLLYASLAGGEDPAGAERFRQRARLFASQFLPWFASDGESVPFGRSLCYRFASVAFFSACAFAGESLWGWGVLKGLVLRNLRYWFAKPIFDHEGVLSIGYGYPDILAAEQYNAPGSPYWALKAYLVLALPEDHPFWTAEEEPLPPQVSVSLNAPPGLLACRAGRGRGEHVYLLNAGQYPGWESVNAAAKYGKFAYSARFGFCVSHGSYGLSKTGCDSSLLLSEGDGYWRERRKTRDRASFDDRLVSVWEPWPDVRIRTWLLPFGPWHARVHEIDSGRELECAEGGFSLPDDDGLGGRLSPGLDASRPGALLVSFPWAYGGIIDLRGAREAELHKPEPNLNILHPRVLVPALRGRIGRGRSLLACAVLAGFPVEGLVEDGDIALGDTYVPPGEAEWASPPRFAYDPESGRAEIESSGRGVALETTPLGRRLS